MESLIAQIKAYAANADDQARFMCIKALQDVMSTLEHPLDSLRRFAAGQTTLVLMQVAIDLNIFQRIVDAGKDGCTLSALVKETGASPDVIGPILRYLAAMGVVKEVDSQVYGANDLTAAMAKAEYQATLRHIDFQGPVFQSLPSYYKENGYKAVPELKRTPFQAAYNTDLDGFQYLVTHPELFKDMHQMMTIQRTSQEWHAVFPVQKELADWDRSKPAMVDVGGGQGHQSIALKQKYPELDGHLVLEDLPDTIQALGQVDGLQLIAHDFFKPQPVKGAKLYYLRNILHDWNDTQAVSILRNIVPAMDASSRILIDETVLLDKGNSWMACQTDMIMINLLGGKERTRSQWHQLCDQAGLVIKEIVLYSPENYHSIIVAVPST